MSGYSEYYRELLEVRPMHFLDKPFTREQVERDLEKALELMGEEDKFFSYTKNHVRQRLPIKDIIYFESVKRQIHIKYEVQLINVNKKFKKYRLYFRTKKGRTYPLVKISCFKKDIDLGNSVFYAASSHLAALYCFMCSCGVMISKGLLSLSMANIMLHTLCETAPIATSLGFDSHFLR